MRSTTERDHDDTKHPEDAAVHAADQALTTGHAAVHAEHTLDAEAVRR